MSSPKLFTCTYRDPVVAYYFLPSNKNVRLTKRFAKVFVHRRAFDVHTGNDAWFQQPESFTDLASAEEYALNLLSVTSPICYEIRGPAPHRVGELTIIYQAA